MKTDNRIPNAANPTISIQGNKGSYSHIAAIDIFGENIQLLERDTFKEVFEDLKHDRAQRICIPIENSTYGSIMQNFDFITNYDFCIVGEIYLKINFHLIGTPDSEFKDITKVYSHPVSIPQFRNFLEENKQIAGIEYSDNAAAVAYAKKINDKSTAAAASKLAAKIYGMKVLKENIHDNPKNYTRFFILAKNHIKKFEVDKKYKTTIEFVLGEEAGSLYKTLRAFADRDISLTKIESRPIINTEWEYRFYLDILASEQDEKLINAFNEIKEYVREMKVLGSYERGKYLDT